MVQVLSTWKVKVDYHELLYYSQAQYSDLEYRTSTPFSAVHIDFFW